MRKYFQGIFLKIDLDIKEQSSDNNELNDDFF